MPIPDEYQEICQLLEEATQEGRVRWIDKQGTTVTVRLPEFNVEIWSGEDEDSQKGFVAVGLRNHSSQKLMDNWYIEEGDNQYEFLYRLWQSARRHAMGIPGKLDSLRNLLKKGGQIGDEDLPF